MTGIGVPCLSLAAVVAVASVSPTVTAQKPNAVLSDRSQPTDFISFAVVSPPTETALDRGKQVALEASVEYELATRGTAFIRALARDEKRATVAAFKASKVVKGRSTYRCAGTVKIPKKGEAIYLVPELYELVQLEPPDSADPMTQQQMAKIRLPQTIASAEVRFEIGEGTLGTRP